MKKHLGTISIVAALFGYVVVIIGLLSSSMRVSFTTFALYAILSIISLISLIIQKGNYKVMIGYVAGASITTVLLLYKGGFAWTTLDSVISAFILACLIIWKLMGAKAAVITSTIAVCAAGIPTAVEMWRHPQASAAFPWILWFLANAISFCARKSWKLEEWFFQGMCALTCAVIAILCLI